MLRCQNVNLAYPRGTGALSTFSNITSISSPASLRARASVMSSARRSMLNFQCRNMSNRRIMSRTILCPQPWTTLSPFSPRSRTVSGDRSYHDPPRRMNDTPRSDRDSYSPRKKFDSVRPPTRNRSAARLRLSETYKKRKLDQKYKQGRDEISKKKAAKETILSEASFEREMQWIGTDRFALGKRIQQMLKIGQFEKAVELVKGAMKAGLDCTVPWNLLFTHLADAKKVHHAVKLFNDMKKRGGKPNYQTFTILLNGFRWSQSPKAVEQAIALYESIAPTYSTSSRIVEPSIIHTNALLTVCTHHHDMDALWSIAGKLPEHGYYCANDITYTIIINGIRYSAQAEIEALDPEKDAVAITEKRNTAVSEGRRLWSDIIRKPQLLQNHQLVSAMGRLLLFGRRENDYQDILALLNQCMGIPLPEEGAKQISRNASRKEEGEKEGEGGEEPYRDIFIKPLKLEETRTTLLAEMPKNLILKFPLPSNSELSLVLQVCQTFTKGIKTARYYWSLLTSESGPYRVKPDFATCHEYLRLLRIGRASSESLDLVRNEMTPRGLTDSKTFIITLSTCSRDRNNPNVLGIAIGLLDEMRKYLLNAKGLLSYLDFIRVIFLKQEKAATTSKPGEQSSPPNELYKARLAEALTHLQPHTHMLRRFIALGHLGINRKRVNKYIDVVKDNDDNSTDTVALNNLAQKTYKGHNTTQEVIDLLLTVLSESYYLHKRLLSPQLSPLLSASERENLKKEVDVLAKYSPYFKSRSVLKSERPTKEVEEVEDDDDA